MRFINVAFRVYVSFTLHVHSHAAFISTWLANRAYTRGDRRRDDRSDSRGDDRSVYMYAL